MTQGRPGASKNLILLTQNVSVPCISATRFPLSISYEALTLLQCATIKTHPRGYQMSDIATLPDLKHYNCTILQTQAVSPVCLCVKSSVQIDKNCNF